MTNNNSDRPPSTYHERASILEDIQGGRFAALGKPIMTGRAPAVEMPRLPASHQHWNGDPAEPLIDATDCSSVFDGTLSRGHPDLDHMSAPPPVVEGTLVPDEVDAPQSIKRRI